MEIYLDDPDVEYAEPNYYRYAMATPNDTYFGQLWGLHNTGQDVNGTSGTADADIDAPEAWDITTGGSDVVIAVIDSGVDHNHPDLSANIWTNPDETAGNGIDDGNGYVDDVRGWDFVDDDNAPDDSNGHGTHVAGTIAAVGNNSTGVTGVSWASKIMVLRFLNAFGLGTIADEISAIEYADAKGAHVINSSMGGPDFSQAEKDAIDASSALVVCAAGNEGSDNDSTPSYPASCTSSNIIAVAATDQNDDLASFSNFGDTSVDVAAPGTDIYSCEPARQTVWSDNFDDGSISDWTTGGTNNTWGTTSPLSYSGSYSLTDSPAGNYKNNTDSWARAPVLDLSSHSGTKLDFKLNGICESSYDGLSVQTSTDLSTWTDKNIYIAGVGVFTGISGSTLGSWLSATVDLVAYDGESTVYIRFRFTSDFLWTYDGWYIDDVAVTGASSSYDGTEYQYMDGTSMAAPHVSGLAALIKAQNSSLTNTEIKVAIESSVDSKASLSGKVATGGRVNAYNALPPTAPGSVSATAASASQIDLSWTDNSSNESGFKIERKTGSGGTYSEIATVAADATSYSDTGLTEASTYYYRICAYNSAGNSSYSDEANATTYLAAPSSLSATAVSSSQIDLSWTDNSSGESGFKIERKTGSGGTYSEIATVAADATSYSDTGLTEASTYYYRICAYNSAGNSSYSDEANATTYPAAPFGDEGGGGGGGCFIATAAYGSQMEPHVKVLCEFRDHFLLTNNVGRTFVELYYTYSPHIADFIAKHATLRAMERLSLLPLVGVSWVTLNLSPVLTLTLVILLLALMSAIAIVALRRTRLRYQA